MSPLLSLRYSARSFLRTPWMALALLFTIALGIGSNVSVHGLVLGLTRPASHLAASDRVVSLFGRDPHRQTGPLSYREYLAAKGHANLFEWLGAARVAQSAIKLDEQSSVVPVAFVTPEISTLLGLSLDQGVVISQRLWQAEFGSRAELIGALIAIDGVDTRLAGIAPDWLEGVYRDRIVDVWAPLRDDTAGRLDPNRRDFWVLGRLQRGTPPALAQSLIQPPGAARNLRVLDYAGLTPEAAAGLSRVGVMLNLAAAAVLFIACVNVVLFLLGRAFTRSHETALRLALGASRAQLCGELLSDSIVISVFGGSLGAILALWISKLLPSLLYEKDAAHLVFASDRLDVVAASALCVAITIVCGLLPALSIPYDRPAAVLRRESSGPSKIVRRLRLSLIVAQMASCCTLVISTAIVIEGLQAALVTANGQQLTHTLFANVHASRNSGLRYFRDVEQATKPMARDSSVNWVAHLPGSLPTWSSFRIEPARLPARDVTLDIVSFTADSLKLFRLPPKSGRLFGLAASTCSAAVVNEAAAAILFDNDSVGRTLVDARGVTSEVVGVMAQTRPADSARPAIFYDFTNRYETPPARVANAHFRTPVKSELPLAELDVNVASAGYFQAAGIKLIAGSGFDARGSSGQCRVGVVNQEAADAYFAGNPLGAAVIDEQGRRTSIIGVLQTPPIGTFQGTVEPSIFLPLSQEAPLHMRMLLHTLDIDVPAQKNLKEVIENVPGRGEGEVIVKSFSTYLTQSSLAPLHIATLILSASAAIALVLSILGLFGALSDAARQRRRELAVRVALGAQRWRVIGQVLEEGGRLASAGSLAGVLASFLVARWIRGITMAAGWPALWVWVAGPLMLVFAVLVASLLPARRALLVSPLTIVREEN